MSRQKGRNHRICLMVVVWLWSGILLTSCRKDMPLSELRYDLIPDIEVVATKQCMPACENNIYEKLTFNIEHESATEAELSRLRMIVYADQAVYDGPYQAIFSVDSICFCEYQSSDIQVELIDLATKSTFIWGTKNTYDLLEADLIEIKLLSEMDWWGNRFKISS